MSTNHTTIRSTALAACLALLFAGATACGTEHGTATTPARDGYPGAQIHEASRPSSADLIEKEKANQHAYLDQLKAQRAHAGRPSEGFGDDRRQSIEHSRSDHAPAGQHSAGYNKALPSEW